MTEADQRIEDILKNLAAWYEGDQDSERWASAFDCLTFQEQERVHELTGVIAQYEHQTKRRR